MREMEEKLSAIMNNPQMMQQIMAMAQAMGNGPPKSPPAKAEPPKPDGFPELDPGMIQKLSGLAKQSSIDSREQGLLKALSAYLPGERIRRLERAMRAAKMAQLATAFLSQQGLLTARR